MGWMLRHPPFPLLGISPHPKTLFLFQTARMDAIMKQHTPLISIAPKQKGLHL